jgi:hypothetical protein
MKTFSLVGGLAGPPSACSAANNRIDVFATGPGNTVWRWSLNGNTWSPPVPLQPGPASIPASGVCAAVSGPGRVEVFALDKTTGAPVWWRGTGTQWLPPTLLPSGANLPSGSPPAAVCASPDNIDVFAAGAGNQPWWWHWDGLRWSAPVPLAWGNLPAERIAAVSPAPGQLDVFAAGAGNHLWHWRKKGSGSFGPAEDLGGSLPLGGVSAISGGLNRIDVFGASGNPANPVQHWWSSGAGFGMDELPMPPKELADAGVAAGTVSAVSHGPNRLDVFGITGDKRVAHWQWDGSSWNGPSHRGDGIPAGETSAVARAWPVLQANLPPRRRVDVFAAGAGNTLLQWPGGGIENASVKNWVNWPSNHVRNGATVARPDNLEELVNVVSAAENNGQGVRAVGSSWSNSDVAVSPGWVIETDKLDGLLTEVTSDCLNSSATGRNLVHVEAGIKLWELNAILDSKGLALHTMGGSSGQSVAGVLSTSAHGMDVDRGPIPDMVRAIHLVGPDGTQHWIEPRDGITNRNAVATVLNLPPENVHYDDNWFNSTLVSVGSLGVIYSLIVEVDPQYDLGNQCDAKDWEVVKADLKGGAGDPFPGNRGVQVVINPYAGATRTCYLSTRKELPKTNPAPGGLPSWLVTAFTAGILPQLRANRLMIPATVNQLTEQNQLDIQIHPTRRYIQGLSHTVMGGPDPGGNLGLTVEAVFDATPPNTGYLDFVDSALKIISDAFGESPPLGYLGWISLRFQGGSRAYLSPQHSADPTKHRAVTAEFAALWRIPAFLQTQQWDDTPVLIDRIEAKAREFGGIQHWGLNGLINDADVIRSYPRLDTWRRVRWQLTKSGTIRSFDSDFTRRCGLSDPPLPALAGDYDHDGLDDFAVWRPEDGNWWFIDSATGAQRSVQFGEPHDIPVPGDYNGDGTSDLAMWNPYTATWFRREAKPVQWGRVGDIPVPGDYNGDGKTDYAVWRPENGTWLVIDSFTGRPRKKREWGQIRDVTVPGDYDGDGKTDYAVWRPENGTWWVIHSSTGQRPTQQWGQPGDIPVPGDYDGDGKTDYAVWRPENGVWYLIESATGKTRAVQWGQPGDIPVPGRYNDPRKTDFAVWRPGDGMWHVLDSTTLTARSQQWGQSGDIPV